MLTPRVYRIDMPYNFNKSMVMRSILLLFLLFFSQLSFSQDAGAFMFVGFSSDDNGFATGAIEGFSLLALEPISAGTTLTLTDGEGVITWITDGVIAPGTVVTFEISQSPFSISVSEGSATETGSFNISGSNESVAISNSSGTCIAAIVNDASAAIEDCSGLSTDFIVRISGDEDLMVYTGSTTCNGTKSDCIAMIRDSNNWTTEDGTGDQSQNGGTDFPDDVPTSFSGSALPVELVNFSAKAIGTTAQLLFTTATEDNNSHFLVQRSFDGRLFETIGRVEGKGYSNQAVEYSFTDTKPNNGINYYRLQQFDFDGSHAFFGPVAVQIRGLADHAPSIWPIPAKDNLQISIPDEDRAWIIEIYDLNGRLLQSQDLQEKTTTTTLDISQLPAGSYLFRWLSGQDYGQQRFIKQ